MKSLFNSAHNREIIDRINKLTNESNALWGKMNVSQMLYHCQVPLEVAYGELKLKKTFIGFLFGRIAKKQLLTKPFKKHLPTDKHFLVKHQPEFENSRKKLIALVERFAVDGTAGITKDSHPFFGKMTSEEWDILQWKHLDHHLSQFGA